MLKNRAHVKEEKVSISGNRVLRFLVLGLPGLLILVNLDAASDNEAAWSRHRSPLDGDSAPP